MVLVGHLVVVGALERFVLRGAPARRAAQVVRAAADGDDRNSDARQLELIGSVEGAAIGERIPVHLASLLGRDLLHDRVDSGLAEAEHP